MHHDKRGLPVLIDARNSDVFESITNGNNRLAVEPSAIENRLRGDIWPDGSRDGFISYKTTVG